MGEKAFGIRHIFDNCGTSVVCVKSIILRDRQHRPRAVHSQSSFGLYIR